MRRRYMGEPVDRFGWLKLIRVRALYPLSSLNLKFQINDDLYGATAPFRRYQHLTFFALLSCIARKNSALLSGVSSG